MLSVLSLLLATQCCCACDCPDAGPPDTGIHADATIPDTGIHPDATVPDSGIHPDASAPDTGVPSTLSAGCGKNPINPLGTYPVVSMGGRSTIIYIPSTYDKNVPMKLISGWCGYSWSAYGCRTVTPIMESLTGNTAILAWPEKASGAQAWDLSPTGVDIAVYDAILSFMFQNYCIDTSEVYAYGRSFGAGMVQTLASHRPATLNGIAMVVPYLPNALAPTSPVNVWMQINTNDSTIYGAGVGPNMKQARDNWASMNGCTPQSPPIPAANQTIRTNYVCTSKKLSFVEINNSSHNPIANSHVEFWNWFSSL